MPYARISELPDNVRNVLPQHAQEIWLAAFNSAMEQYDDENRARRVAWAAVKQVYEQDEEGNWVRKKEKSNAQTLSVK